MFYTAIGLPVDAAEYLVAYLMGLGWELIACLPWMLSVAGVRWILARILGFERKPRLWAVLTGLVSPYLFLALILLHSLLEEAFGWPGLPQVVPILLCGALTVAWDRRVSRRHIIHPDPKRLRTYHLAAIALLIFTLLF